MGIRSSTGGLGEVRLTSYGSYACALKVGRVTSPGFDARKYAMPAAPGARVDDEQKGAGSVTFTVQADGRTWSPRR
jgi:hypothetical protein